MSGADKQIECLKCRSDRVAIECLPFDVYSPALLVCRDCGHVFDAAEDSESSSDGSAKR